MAAANIRQFAVPSPEDFNALSDKYKARIHEAFELFDTNKDGLVNYEEFRFTLRALGFDLPKPQTYDMLVRYAQRPADWQPNDECPPIYRLFSLSTVQALAGTLIAKRDPTEEAKRAFKLFDRDGKGIITKDDLERVCKAIGSDIPVAQLEAMIDEFDASGKGGVDEAEFVRLQTRK